MLYNWYTRYELQVRVAGFYVIGNVSTGLSGLLAYGIERLAGTDGLNGWRWIFIIVRGNGNTNVLVWTDRAIQEGAVSAFIGVCSFFIIVDFPEKAAHKNSIGMPGFLTPEEAAVILARVERDRGDAVEDKMSFKVAMKHFRDWKLWEFNLYVLLNVSSR